MHTHTYVKKDLPAIPWRLLHHQLGQYHCNLTPATGGKLSPAKQQTFCDYHNIFIEQK